ncbi:MAG TPA: hypothetical protein PLX89_11060 [Verrucomicrobiota bacterium]|nr:hypothetical protein [Verrucomicrobiota bacterium]
MAQAADAGRTPRATRLLLFLAAGALGSFTSATHNKWEPMDYRPI